MYYGNLTAAKRTVDHILSYMRSSPTWPYNGGARSWGDAGNNAKWLPSFGTGTLILKILHTAPPPPFFFKMAQNLDLRCVLVPAPYESRIKKFTPHCVCRPEPARADALPEWPEHDPLD